MLQLKLNQVSLKMPLQFLLLFSDDFYLFVLRHQGGIQFLLDRLQVAIIRVVHVGVGRASVCSSFCPGHSNKLSAQSGNCKIRLFLVGFHGEPSGLFLLILETHWLKHLGSYTKYGCS